MNKILNILRYTLLFLIGGRSTRIRLMSDGTPLPHEEEYSTYADFLLVVGIIMAVLGFIILITKLILSSIMIIIGGAIAATVGLALSKGLNKR